MATFVCPLCGKHLIGVHTITRHRDNLKKANNDPSRCDNVLKRGPASSSSSDDLSVQPTSSDVFAAKSDLPVQPTFPPTQNIQQHEGPNMYHPNHQDSSNRIVRPLRPVDWFDFARRAPACDDTTLVTRTRVVAKTERNVSRPRDLITTQQRWEHYKKIIYSLFSQQFWTFFLPLHTFSAVNIDAALKAAKAAFVTDKKRKAFPLSKRQMMEKIATIAPFWPQVMQVMCRRG